MKFKKDIEPVYTTEPEYDLFYGGYIDPNDLLDDKELSAKINDAISLIQIFLQEAEEQGVLEIG